MKINKLLKIGRTSDWWEYKIPPLLAIAYATIIKNDSSLIEMIPGLLFLLLALGFGGIYAYTINDLTDINEDYAAGKSNQMAKFNPRYRWMIPFTFFLGGFAMFCVFIYKGDYLSGFIYGLPCVCFSLYSFRPFRLKERGIWGILADALGAHFFLSLLMVSSLTYMANKPIDWLWFSLVGAWSLVFGVRGILWHQFYDLGRDLQAGIKTYATSINIHKFKKFEISLFFIELSLFAAVLTAISSAALWFSFLIYTLLAFFRYRLLRHQPVIIINPAKPPLQILLLDFYIVFFPLGILLQAAIGDPWILTLGAIHILLFHEKLIYIIRDLVSIVKLQKLNMLKKFKHV